MAKITVDSTERTAITNYLQERDAGCVSVLPNPQSGYEIEIWLLPSGKIVSIEYNDEGSAARISLPVKLETDMFAEVIDKLMSAIE